jgi:hypothetical protein
MTSRIMPYLTRKLEEDKSMALKRRKPEDMYDLALQILYAW